jgi:hypothetical protein
MKQSPPICCSPRGSRLNESLTSVWHLIADHLESHLLFDIEVAEECVVAGAIRGWQEACTCIYNDSFKHSFDNPITHTLVGSLEIRL